VTALCHLLDTVRPMASSHFLHGAPGSRAYSACLAVISAELCRSQQSLHHSKWDCADAAAWELVPGRVLPRLHDLQGSAQVLAAGGVKDTQQLEQEQQQQQQGGVLAYEQGAQHREHADPGGGEGRVSSTICAQDPFVPHPAAHSGGGVSQLGARSDLCPPADLALLMLMAAAHTVKAGVKFHCFGSSCCNCGLWHPREPARGEGSSKGSKAGEHHPHKEQPSDGCDVCSSVGQVNQST
jgi:hypothetical protein